MIEQEICGRQVNNVSKYAMKGRRAKIEAKPITITAERLSDHSRITFTISSNKTIEHLRALLNLHLPPLIPDKFDLYSYQRGARIHFPASSLTLDYFPVIFDQSVLLLKMDDQHVNESDKELSKNNRKSSKKGKYLLLDDLLSTKTNTKTSNRTEQQSSTNVTCLTILKQLFLQSSSHNVNTNSDSNILTY